MSPSQSYRRYIPSVYESTPHAATFISNLFPARARPLYDGCILLLMSTSVRVHALSVENAHEFDELRQCQPRSSARRFHVCNSPVARAVSDLPCHLPLREPISATKSASEFTRCWRPAFVSSEVSLSR